MPGMGEDPKLLINQELRAARQTGTLDLADRGLTAVPPEVSQITNLTMLFLNGNQLTALPPEISHLTKLEALDLSGNQLTMLPPEISQLVNLRSLALIGNQLTIVPPEISHLTNLQALDLSGNQLTMLAPEIGYITDLQTLILSGNQLTALPPEIGRLVNLQELDISHNQLTTLPSEFAVLLTKTLINLELNPLREPFARLIGRGADALAAYLRSLEDAIPNYEGKVLLVGEGNVGKTSLIAALCGAPFIEGRPTTHGIEIQPLTMLDSGRGVDMTVRAWDFGGQEVYRITHQFFFSQRALYLVVWNSREGQEQNEVEGWLRRIRLRVGSEARALVVATHCDESRPELDFPYLAQMFPELLVGQCEVDNRTGFGIPELRKRIFSEAVGLPQMGQLISRRWMAARDEIMVRAETDPQIPYGEFASICQRHDINDEEAVTLAELMHDLGYIVYYGDDEGLRDFVVLNPEWLTKAISYVLEDVPTRQSGGVLDHARLLEIWRHRQDGFAYPARYHPYFLRLMEKFDVSYRLEDDEYRSLVAQLVPYGRPDLPWDFRTPPAAGIRQLALVCRLREPVPGLVAWMTVRHHRASTGKHWRNGVFLRHPIATYSSEALVELRTPVELTINVRAPSPDLFFNVLRDSVEDLITRRWPGLGYELLIPCPTRLANGDTCQGHFPLGGLLGYRERSGRRAPCWECHMEYDLSELLTGFAQPHVPLLPELARLQDQLADVASGVSRLEGYAADAADSMRRVLRIVGNEVADCPRLFTLTPENRTGTRRLKFYQRHYRLILWCEHPGHWHPWPAASYSLDQPSNWLVRIGPYATLVFKVLRLVVPIAASVTGVVLTDEQLKNAHNELQLMTTLVAHLPDHAVGDRRNIITLESASQLTLAEGQALRAIRVLLFEHDYIRAFGGLRRVQAPSGDFLWICAEHYSEYDPGLPDIPEPKP